MDDSTVVGKPWYVNSTTKTEKSHRYLLYFTTLQSAQDYWTLQMMHKELFPVSYPNDFYLDLQPSRNQFRTLILRAVPLHGAGVDGVVDGSTTTGNRIATDGGSAGNGGTEPADVQHIEFYIYTGYIDA
uniref:Serine/threonine-protein kinase WNK2 n=1 Tax=Lygus hesperus TaxID=30085 RepID=A0A0A9Z357_LYGHE